MSDTNVIGYSSQSECKAAHDSSYTAPIVTHEAMETILPDEDSNEDRYGKSDALEYTRREEFTSEIHKIEIRGLPKFFPAGVSHSYNLIPYILMNGVKLR